MDGFHWGWMLIGGLMMLLFWGGLIALAVMIIRALSGSTGSGQARPASHGRALDILEERYARGEIDREEFEAKWSDLSH
ncbi:MAG: SHOCT domain-containing protein [Anaerolineales bacterium]